MVDSRIAVVATEEPALMVAAYPADLARSQSLDRGFDVAGPVDDVTDVMTCPLSHCRGAMRLVKIAKTPDEVARVLAELGLGPRPRHD